MQEATEFWDLMTEEYVRGYIHATEAAAKVWADVEIEDELYMFEDQYGYWRMVDTQQVLSWDL